MVKSETHEINTNTDTYQDKYKININKHKVSKVDGRPT